MTVSRVTHQSQTGGAAWGRAAFVLRENGGALLLSVADIPSGTGLGSSSSFTVALVNALYVHRRIFVPKARLAHETCVREIDRLGEPIGKQDQYAAANGGINLIEFESQGVTVQPLLRCRPRWRSLRQSHAVFTGSQRDARTLLTHQVAAIETDEGVVSRMQQMVELVYEMRALLLAGDLDAFGLALHRG